MKSEHMAKLLFEAADAMKRCEQRLIRLEARVVKLEKQARAVPIQRSGRVHQTKPNEQELPPQWRSRRTTNPL